MARLGGTPIVKPAIFVRFSLFLIFNHTENWIHLALMDQKFKFLEGQIEMDPLELATPISVPH